MDIIPLTFSVVSDNTALVISINSQSDGFTIIQQPSTSQETMSAKIMYDGYTDKPQITINIVFSDNAQFTTIGER
jgi:hypothetical protein